MLLALLLSLAAPAQELSCALGDPTGLPPAIIQVAEQELLREDAEALYSVMLDAGVEVSLEVYPSMWHDFQVQAGLLRTSDRALDELARFIDRPAVKR